MSKLDARKIVARPGAIPHWRPLSAEDMRRRQDWAEWRERARERFYDGFAVGFGAGMIAAFALAWLT